MSATTRTYYADTVDAWVPIIQACTAVGIHADVAELGGGCICLHVPLSEDHTRWVWLGTDSDGSEPLWIGPDGPQMVLGGCAYRSVDGDEDSSRQAQLKNADTDPADPAAVVATILNMVRAAMALPDEEYHSI